MIEASKCTPLLLLMLKFYQLFPKLAFQYHSIQLLQTILIIVIRSFTYYAFFLYGCIFYISPESKSSDRFYTFRPFLLPPSFCMHIFWWCHIKLLIYVLRSCTICKVWKVTLTENFVWLHKCCHVVGVRSYFILKSIFSSVQTLFSRLLDCVIEDLKIS